MPHELPRGRYLSCAFQVGANMGGQTRAMLMRNRILARDGGARPDILTFGASPGFAATRAELLEQGLLTDELRMLNLYEHYREHGWRESEGARATPLADLGEHRVGEDLAPDGSVWRTHYQVPGEESTLYDFRRRDGSPFLRM